MNISLTCKFCKNKSENIIISLDCEKSKIIAICKDCYNNLEDANEEEINKIKQNKNLEDKDDNINFN